VLRNEDVVRAEVMVHEDAGAMRLDKEDGADGLDLAQEAAQAGHDSDSIAAVDQILAVPPRNLAKNENAWP